MTFHLVISFPTKTTLISKPVTGQPELRSCDAINGAFSYQTPTSQHLRVSLPTGASAIMAFNFNWSPLTADASFYTRVQELLTTALNKSPKPPIIVDDIIVNELNLGSVPPDLEILEVGDLAEDRFRGIFKMCYTGDAYLTLRTRVQASFPHGETV